MSSGRVLTRKILPSLVFPSVSVLAAYIIFGHAKQSGMEDIFHAKCSSPGVSPMSLKYTGIGVIDYQLCGLVAVFHALMQPSNLPFNVDLLSGLGSVAAVPVLETARQKRHGLLATHVIISLIYQRMTAAVLLPWFYLIFITTGAAQINPGPGARVSQARAEAVFLSVILGYVVPSATMLVLDNPYATAFWQPFPLWMFIIERAYLAIRPSTRQNSGYRTIQAMHATLFLIAAVAHFYFMGPIMLAGDHARTRALFIPSLNATPKSAPAEVGVLHFIQWDVIFVSLSTLLASLWTAKSVGQFFGMLIWFVVGGGILGPGATLVVISAWRERRLNGGASKGEKHQEKQD